MNTPENCPMQKKESTVSDPLNDDSLKDSLDIEDPELIKFMNAKMNIKSETILDLFFDLASVTFDNIVIAPYNYIYDYFTQFFPKDFFDKFRTTLFLNGPVLDEKYENKLPVIQEEEEDYDDVDLPWVPTL